MITRAQRVQAMKPADMSQAEWDYALSQGWDPIEHLEIIRDRDEQQDNDPTNGAI